MLLLWTRHQGLREGGSGDGGRGRGWKMKNWKQETILNSTLTNSNIFYLPMHEYVWLSPFMRSPMHPPRIAADRKPPSTLPQDSFYGSNHYCPWFACQALPCCQVGSGLLIVISPSIFKVGNGLPGRWILHAKLNYLFDDLWFVLFLTLTSQCHLGKDLYYEIYPWRKYLICDNFSYLLSRMKI